MSAWTLYRTPFGPGCVLIDSDSRKIEFIRLPGRPTKGILPKANAPRGEFARWTVEQLEAYYRPGVVPEDLSRHLADVADTPFRRAILTALGKVRRGTTLGYADLARSAGMKHPSRYGRSVGQVMAWNPLPLVMPCHRVLDHDGRLGNYGGGVEMKRHLLECEGALPARVA